MVVCAAFAGLCISDLVCVVCGKFKRTCWFVTTVSDMNCGYVTMVISVRTKCRFNGSSLLLRHWLIPLLFQIQSSHRVRELWRCNSGDDLKSGPEWQNFKSSPAFHHLASWHETSFDGESGLLRFSYILTFPCNILIFLDWTIFFNSSV